MNMLNISSEYIPVVIMAIIALILIEIALFIDKDIKKSKEKLLLDQRKKRWKEYLQRVSNFLGDLPVIKFLKKDIEDNLILCVDKNNAKILSVMIIILSLIISIIILFYFADIGEIWYTKVLNIIFSIVLPYYTLSLCFDYIKFGIHRKVPEFIEQFKSSYIQHRRIKPALIDSAKYLGIAGKLVIRAAEYPDFEKGLDNLKETINETWFNIFIDLIKSSRESGGDLLTQLYRLNRTMTSIVNTEKKKNRRLIWYELFTVMSVIVGVPLIYMVNNKIINEMMISNTSTLYTNFAFSRIIIYSIIALVITRLVRKM